MKKLCSLVIGLIALPALADNNQGFYVGLGGAAIADYQDGIKNLKKIKAEEFFGGYKYNDALGVELRIGRGVSSTTSSVYFDEIGKMQSGSLVRDIDGYQSIFYKPELVNDEAKLYALLGYTQVKTTVNIKTPGLDSTEKLTASGYSYGIGVGFIVNEHFNVNIEYKNICDEISGKPNLASLNVDYRF